MGCLAFMGVLNVLYEVFGIVAVRSFGRDCDIVKINVKTESRARTRTKTGIGSSDRMNANYTICPFRLCSFSTSANQRFRRCLISCSLNITVIIDLWRSRTSEPRNSLPVVEYPVNRSSPFSERK